jgi:hypothetical protein
MQALISILQRLQLRGVGIRNQTIFAGTGADIPNAGTIVTVTETGGVAPLRLHTGGIANVAAVIRQPSFQIVARSIDYVQAANKAEQAYVALQFENTLVEGVFWIRVIPLSEPFTLPVDANGRNRVAFNIETVRR